MRAGDPARFLEGRESLGEYLFGALNSEGERNLGERRVQARPRLVFGE
jgi:hypothetical protein